MPYASIADLPDAVKTRYSARCQEVFRKAFNGHEGTEESRFKVAHTAAGNCKDSGKAILSSAMREHLPDSAYACPEKRLYPHHHADGALDMVRLRNALSRIAQAGTDKCGQAHLEMHAREENIGGRKSLQTLKATVIDDDAFRLLAIPFGGPIPSKASPLGVDLDGEWFDDRTDIKPDWFDVRLVDWHHRTDQRIGRTVIGKATDLAEDDDGWWVTIWLNRQKSHFELIRRLVERGAQLFGSSETSPRLVRKSGGHIDVWPYMMQTISPIPSNTMSVLRPLKAVLDDYTAADIFPTAAFFADLAGFVDELARPSADLTGEADAKAGRVIAARNEERLREGIEAIRERGWDPVLRERALARIAEVLAELERYVD